MHYNQGYYFEIVIEKVMETNDAFKARYLDAESKFSETEQILAGLARDKLKTEIKI